jgi:hypothetical protein
MKTESLAGLTNKVIRHEKAWKFMNHKVPDCFTLFLALSISSGWLLAVLINRHVQETNNMGL